MNKTIKIALTLAVVVIAVALVLHHVDFTGVMRKLHGG